MQTYTYSLNCMFYCCIKSTCVKQKNYWFFFFFFFFLNTSYFSCFLCDIEHLNSLRKNNCGLSNIYSVVEHEAITFFFVTVLSLMLFEISSFFVCNFVICESKNVYISFFFFCSSVGSVYCHVMSYTCLCVCACVRAHMLQISTV